MKLTESFSGVVCSRWFAYVLALLLPIAGSAAYRLVYQPPVPEVMDEFSYLLAADTFAGGRLTNPPHPLWVFFETHHVIQQPTYASKYPPAQGLVLLLGQRMGDPVWGITIGLVFMCLSMVWMLRAYLPPGWALLGLIVCAMNLCVYHYWAQSFWGGAVAATGGALIAGGIRRIWDRGLVRDVVFLGIGFIILLFSRPVEGFIYSVIPGLIFLAWCVRNRNNRRLVVSRLLTLVVLLSGGLGFLLVYHKAVTGSSFTFPIQAYERQYSGFNPLHYAAGTTSDKPEFRHKQMERFHQIHILGKLSGHDHWWRTYLSHSKKALDGILGPVLGMALVFGLASPGLRGRTAVAATWLTLSLMFVFNPTIFHVHYIAPATGLLFLVSVAGLKQIWSLSEAHRNVGRTALLLMLLCFVVSWVDRNRAPKYGYGLQRQQIIEKLRGEAGRDVVLVDYRDDAFVHAEWVYNRADIDTSDIVWARDMGADRNQELFDYYPDRRFWRLTVGADRHQLAEIGDRSREPVE